MIVTGRMMARIAMASRSHPVKIRNHYVFMFLNLKQSFMTSQSLIFIKRKKEHMIYGYQIRPKIIRKVV